MDSFLVLLFACMAGSFALCGVPFGLIIARALGDVDVREHGSGNIGMTNVARTVGGEAAALTFLCDMGKGAASVCLSRLLLGLVAPEGVSLEAGQQGFAALTLVYACCVAGHVFSPYLGFHGGKGVSVGFGAALGLYWPCGAALLFVFLALALPTGYVSAGSLAAAITLPLQCYIVWHFTLWSTLPILLVAAVVIWAHRSNVVKLLHGEESAFSIRPGARRSKKKVAPTKRRSSDGRSAEER